MIIIDGIVVGNFCLVESFMTLTDNICLRQIRWSLFIRLYEQFKWHELISNACKIVNTEDFAKSNWFVNESEKVDLTSASWLGMPFPRQFSFLGDSGNGNLSFLGDRGNENLFPRFRVGVRGNFGEYFVSDLKLIWNFFLLKRICFEFLFEIKRIIWLEMTK